MRVRVFILAMLLLIAPAVSADVLDRVVASVNGQVILQTDWDEQVRYEAFMAKRPLVSITQVDRQAALDRLIDEELVDEQVRPADFTPPTSAEIDKQLEQMKSQFLKEQPGESWNAALANYRLTEDQLREGIGVQLEQMKIVDGRLRPTVQIDESAVAEYYNRKLLPELHRSAEQPPTLQEAAPQIREILIQQKINEALPSWLEGLRSQAQIRLLTTDSLPEPTR